MSNKTINEALKDVFLELGGNPSELSDNQTISDYIEDLGGAIEDAASGAAESIIDDTAASASKTYSSNKINALTAPELPAVTGSDNGKVLGVSNGAWGIINAPGAGVEVEFITLGMTNNLPEGMTGQDVYNKLSAGKYIVLRQVHTGGYRYFFLDDYTNYEDAIGVTTFILSFNSMVLATNKLKVTRLYMNTPMDTYFSVTNKEISYDA